MKSHLKSSGLWSQDTLISNDDIKTKHFHLRNNQLNLECLFWPLKFFCSILDFFLITNQLQLGFNDKD